MRFGEKLRALRTEKGMSQAEIARRLGISRSVICNYENGKRQNITAPVLKALAKELGVTWQELVLDTELQEIAAIRIDGYTSIKSSGNQMSFNNYPIKHTTNVQTSFSREHLCHMIDTMDEDEIDDVSSILGAYTGSNENGRKSLTQHAWEVKQIADYRFTEDHDDK